MKDILDIRKIAISRELTKKYEEVFRGTIDQAINKFKNESPRGEFVVVVEGISKEKLKKIENSMWDDMTIKEHIQLYIDQGFNKKEAVKMVANERNIPKKEVYKESIGL